MGVVSTCDLVWHIHCTAALLTGWRCGPWLLEILSAEYIQSWYAILHHRAEPVLLYALPFEFLDYSLPGCTTTERREDT
jgi:hypothetical protein